MTESRTRQDGALLCFVALVLASAMWLYRLARGLRHQLWFDDAYMFYRYAWNMRHGLGISWNLDGMHTYGETAPLWGLIVYLLSFLSASPSTLLMTGSWLCSVGAVVAMAWAVGSHAESVWLARSWRVMALVAFPLSLTPIYILNTMTGMETMLGAALVALFVGVSLAWLRGVVPPELAGLAGILLFLTRPEAALLVVLFPACLYLLTRHPLRSRDTALGLLRLLGIFAAGVAADLLLAKLYFHTALPLSFYVKGHQAYEGYIKYWHPTMSLFDFLAGCVPFLLVISLASGKKDVRLLLAFAFPLLCMCLYLETVVQIMGFSARYYVPYLPMVVVPALLVLDGWLLRRNAKDEAPRKAGLDLLPRAAGALIVLLLLVTSLRNGLALTIDRHTEKQQYGYAPVTLQTNAAAPLQPHVWAELWIAVADTLVAPLPRGAVVASSEVGSLGARGLQVNVIDLAGLNDTGIALHGFDPGRLLAQKPDLIWLPHNDYTWQRGVIVTAPAFLRDYELYAGAANSGIAIRKDSPNRPQLERNMDVLWARLYPGTAKSNYLATSATWTKQKSPALDN